MKEDSFLLRMRLAACCMVLAAIAIVQDPGKIVSDTKIDLVIAPGSFLSKSLSFWDPTGAFGQVQNQAYGYLFPMGPFFWSGHELGIEPWLVQRLWWALIFVVAFLGFVKLSRELRLGVQWAQLAGGLLFALSPRVLSIVGQSSIEVWPAAVAPWVLIPLVVGTKRRSPVAMAALSALAVVCVGGVNAAATFAVIPLGALWLIMTRPGPRRRRMMLWWPLFVVIGTLWWLIPLLLLGQYSPPFLDYIESSSLTTFAATLLDALRGTSNWTAYFSETSNAGRMLLTDPVLILNVSIVAAFGVVGIARSDNPHRRFLFAAVLMGLVLVTLGHTATHGGSWASGFQSALDGVLAPLRNTHKFDLVVRLPLALGFVHVLSMSAQAHVAKSRSGFRWTPGLGVAMLAVAALFGATSPAWSGHLASRGSFVEIPGYWKAASSWLAGNANGDRALLVPASTFGTSLWGTTNDEAMQPLAKSPWAVRNAIPLAQPGNIRMLDAIESRITDGRGSEALANYLGDSGVGYLVVRNDLRASTDGLDPELVYETLSGMPGVTRVAGFGPEVGGSPRLERDDGSAVFVDQGWQSEHQAVEIYKVSKQTRTRAQPSSSVPVVVGDPESQLSLLESGLLKSRSVVFAHDANVGQRPQELILTDGQRRQEVAFGRTHNNRSSSMGPTEKYSVDRPAHDFKLSTGLRWQTVPRLRGAKKISASSSESSANAFGAINKASQPWSAIDGDPLTSWTASSNDIGKRSWITIKFNSAVDITGAKITLDRDPVVTDQLSLKTDSGSGTFLARGGKETVLPRMSKPTRELRISAPSTTEARLSISEISIPGVELSRPLVLPTPPKRWGSPERILLHADSGFRSGCLEVDGYMRCASGQDGWGEDGRSLDRLLTIPEEHKYPLELTVEPIGGAAIDRVIQRGQLVNAESSSQVVRSPRASVLNAIDGDDKTAWIAAASDSQPKLTLSWFGKRKISSIAVRLDKSIAASRPSGVTLVFSDGSRQRTTLTAAGVAKFKPVSTNRIEFRFDDVKAIRNLNSDGTGGLLPVGVSELGIGESDLVPNVILGPVRKFGCGSGPQILIDGQSVKSAIAASPKQLQTGGELKARICGPDDVDLGPGTHRVQVVGTDSFRPVSLAMGGPAVRSPVSTFLTPTVWDATNRAVRFDSPAGNQLLSVTENFNRGWVEQSGAGRPVIVNGWQQGWVLDSKARADVRLKFEPNTEYRWALAIGGISACWLLILALCLLRLEQTNFAIPRARRGSNALSLLGVLALGGTFVSLGGLTGLACASLGMAVAAVLRKRADPATLAGLVVGSVGSVSALRPWSGSSPWFGSMDWPQLAIAVSLGLVAGSVLGLPNVLKRFRGVSINRKIIADNPNVPTRVSTRTSTK